MNKSEEARKKVSESMKKFHEKKRLEKLQSSNLETNPEIGFEIKQPELIKQPEIQPEIELNYDEPNPNVDYSTLGVVDQIRLAVKSENRLATFAGFLLGGIVPFITYILAHYEISSYTDFYSLFSQIATYLIIGGLIYSFNTVFYFGKLAFDSSIKSFGFTLLIEGTMT
jgi:hypothetical protein